MSPASPAGAVSRNAPCPCGSGRRFRDCHGALGAATGAAAPDGYQPAGDDWNDVDHAVRGRLSQLMEQALAKQRAGDPLEAERLYREVVAAAPRTFDAVHMLAAVRAQRNDLEDAWAFMERACTLRPPTPDVIQNRIALWRKLVAYRRDRNEAQAEALLPGLLERFRQDDGSRATAGPLHLVVGSRDDASEAAWVASRFQAILAPWRPQLWVPHEGAAPEHGWTLRGGVGEHPVGGVQVHVGLDGVADSSWMRAAAPSRVVAIGLRAPPAQWHDALTQLAREGAVPLRVVFVSADQAWRFGVDGPLLPPLDAARLRPRPPGSRGVTVGMVAGRADILDRVTEGALVRRLLAGGVAVAIRDPGALRYELGALPGVRFEARDARPLEAFVESVDVLLVPARRWHGEGLDREVGLAIASGRAVVARRTSIHVSTVGGLIDGHIVDDDTAALDVLLRMAREGRPGGAGTSAPYDDAATRDAVAAALGLAAPPA